jgi:hypothetical protein
MKKILLSTMLLFAASAQAQETLPALTKGKFMVETNLSPFSMIKTTGFSLASNDGSTEWGVGGEAGYFAADKLAVKFGLGIYGAAIDYGFGKETSTAVSYKIGAKYYVANNFPFQLDLGGLNSEGENALLLGAQVGYAWFLKDNISIEPGIRYDHGLDDNASGVKTVSAKIGFSLYF